MYTHIFRFIVCIEVPGAIQTAAIASCGVVGVIMLLIVIASVTARVIVVVKELVCDAAVINVAAVVETLVLDVRAGVVIDTGVGVEIIVLDWALEFALEFALDLALEFALEFPVSGA